MLCKCDFRMMRILMLLYTCLTLAKEVCCRAEGICGRCRRFGDPVGVAVAERDVILGMPEPPYIPPRTDPSGNLKLYSSSDWSVYICTPRNEVKKKKKNFNSL